MASARYDGGSGGDGPTYGPTPPRGPIPRKGWEWGLAPHIISIFVWVAYFDQLGPRTLAVGGLPAAGLGAAAAGLLAFGLIFYAPALWGQRTGLRLVELAEWPFGRRGSRWVPDLLWGLAQVAFLAVAVAYAADFTLRGLAMTGLVSEGRLAPMVVGGRTVPAPAYLFTVVVWSYFLALTGAYFVRLVMALMNVYPAVVALLVGGVFAWALPGLAHFRAPAFDPATGQAAGGSLAAALAAVQMIFGFVAAAGAGSADWGAASRTPRDVRLGGLVGVAFAAFVLAVVPLLSVAGTLGRRPPPPALAGPLEAQAGLVQALAMRPHGSYIVEEARDAVRQAGAGHFTYRAALEHGIGGTVGGVLLICFGLASMAPAVFAAHIFCERLKEARPRSKRWHWALVAATLALPLIVLGLPRHLATLYGVLGGLLAPVAGVLAAGYVRSRGAWPGARRGVNPSGMAAWAVGAVVGLLPYVGPAAGLGAWSGYQPAAVFAFAAAFVVALILGMLGLESRLEEVAPPPE